jgi:ornithine carbamoyltransferase
VRIGAPAGYQPDPGVLAAAAAIAARTGGSVQVSEGPAAAAAGADVLATDVWTSMGQEAESLERRSSLTPYGITEDLLAQAQPGAAVLHCLPAHRGEEISETVLEGPQSVVWDQAENRLHAQKALLCWLLGERP